MHSMGKGALSHLRMITFGGHMKPINYIFSFTLIILLVFSACGSPLENVDSGFNNNGNNTDLAVVTVCYVESSSPIYNEYIEEIAEYYNLLYDGKAQIKLEPITFDIDERENAISKVKTEVLSGKGPDIYLFECNDESYYHKPFFEDVNKAMHTGAFANITSYFEADEEIDAEDFYGPVMNAGKIGKNTYVLPITFTYDTAFVNKAKLLNDIDEAALESGSEAFINALINQKISMSDPYFYAVPKPLSMFSQPINYYEEKVNVSIEDLEKAIKLAVIYYESNYGEGSKPMELFQGVETEEDLVNKTQSLDISEPARLTYFSQWALSGIAFNISEKNEFKEFPFPTIDGGFNAMVTSFAAVSANCHNLEEAYNFIRLFIKDEFQQGKGYVNTENGRSYGKGKICLLNDWPVRSDISIEELYKSSSSYMHKYPLDEDVYTPCTDKITSARFYTKLDKEASDITDALADEISGTENLPNEKIQKAAEKIYSLLQAAASE